MAQERRFLGFASSSSQDPTCEKPQEEPTIPGTPDTDLCMGHPGVARPRKRAEIHLTAQLNKLRRRFSTLRAEALAASPATNPTQPDPWAPTTTEKHSLLNAQLFQALTKP